MLATPDQAVAGFLKIAVHIKGRNVGKPAPLYPFQEKWIRPLYERAKDGTRKHRTALFCLPKKEGKSYVFAALGLEELTMFGEYGGNVFTLASSSNQGEEMYTPAMEMAQRSPALQGLELQIRNATKEIRFPLLGNRYQVLPGDAQRLHGKAPRVLLVDELHAITKRETYDNIREGMGIWDDALTVFITNWGEIGGSGPFWDELAQAEEELKNPLSNWFVKIARAPSQEDMTDEELLTPGKHWAEFHDGMGTLVKRTFLIERAAEARTKPSLKNSVLRLHFCRPTQPVSAGINVDKWAQCQRDFSEKQLDGDVAFGGLDLSKRSDLSAYTMIFPLPYQESDELDENADSNEPWHPLRFRMISKIWVPENMVPVLEKKTGKPFGDWVNRGLITATPGDVVDYDYIEDTVKASADAHDLQAVGYDRTFASQLYTRLDAAGVTMIDLDQTAAVFTEPWQSIEQSYLNQKLEHTGCPVLRYCAESLQILTTMKGAQRPAKIERDESKRRIDPLVALLMAKRVQLDFPIMARPDSTIHIG